MELRLSHPDDQLREQFLTLERPQDIADLLEISYPLLQYWLFIAPPTDKYITFMLHKASGGLRIISAPTTTLKIIQQKLNQVLQAVYEVKKPVHGFVIGKSIVTNALAHAKQHYVFNIDLQDFFPSINFGRVRGLFMGKPYNLPANVATVLAQICCHENALPQGASTSPIVANMICGQLDDQLLSLAKKRGCRYTRYADDITFSSSRLIFPPTIATSEYKVQSGIGKISWQIGSELETLIQDNGFKVNLDKVRMQTINQHQEVTGLTTNEFPNVNRQYIRQIRAMLHAWEKYGSKRAHQEYYNQRVQGQRGPYKDAPPFKQIVKGKIEFLGMVRGKDNPIYQRFLQQYRSLAPRNVQTRSLRSAPTSVETPQRFNFPQWIETLPFPLASILRVYDVDDDDKEKFDHLLKFFEALTTFWAIILLSGFYSDEAEFKKILRNFKNLQNPSFGTWLQLITVFTGQLQERTAQNLKGDTDSHLFKTQDNQIVNLLSSSQLIQVLREAKSFRNNRAHGGYLSQKEARQKLNDLRAHLNTVIEMFGDRWSTYKLIIPINSTYSSGLHDYRIQHIIGSNAIFKKDHHVFEHPLENGKLYLVAHDSQQALKLLPLVRLGSLPEMAQNACYFYNGQEDGKVKWVTHHFVDEKSEVLLPDPEVIQFLNLFSNK